MTARVPRPFSKQVFEKYYARTYSSHVGMRIGSIVLVSGVLLYLNAISLGVLAAWLVSYVSSELATMAWWRRVAPRLETATQGQFAVFENQLIAITAVLSASASAPLLFASPTTSTGVWPSCW